MLLAQENLVCPVCQTHFLLSNAKNVGYPARGISAILAKFKPDSIYFCPSCQAGISYPVLSDQDIDSIYAQGDYWGSYKIQRIEPNKNPGQYVMASARWEFIRQIAGNRLSKNNISILDIGGGHGFIGVAALEEKTQLKEFCVVEKDKFFRDSLLFTWQLSYPNVSFNVIENLDDVTGQFDVIVLSHILEHLNNPRAMISSASRHLAPEGFILIDVPYKDYLFKPDVFPHVLFYYPESLKVMCQGLGLHVMAVNPYGRGRKNKLMFLLEKCVYASRRFLPLALIKAFYNWYFLPLNINQDGVWVRALVKKNKTSA